MRLSDTPDGAGHLLGTLETGQMSPSRSRRRGIGRREVEDPHDHHEPGGGGFDQ